jgi:hypothetical protein
MMTGALQSQMTHQVRPVNRLRERIFFGSMTALLFASVLLGFARTYYLAGMVRAPLPSVTIHIHGAVFSLWFVLLVVQTALIPAGRVGWHRSLGLVSYGVAVLMVVLGVLAATDSLRRNFSIGPLDPSTSFALSVIDISVFGVLIGCSYLARRKPDVHKRLVLYATLAMMGAAIDRWPFQAWGMQHSASPVIFTLFLLPPVAYDLISLHKIHRATIFGAGLVYLFHKLEIPIGKSHACHVLASYLLTRH